MGAVLSNRRHSMKFRPETEQDGATITSRKAPQTVERITAALEQPYEDLSVDPRTTAQGQNNSGWSHFSQFKVTGRLDDLDRAIECFSCSAALTPDGDPSFAARLSDMGTAFGARFEWFGELADLEKAVTHISRALMLTPDGHPDIPQRHASLGVCYGIRYQRLGDPADLDKVIQCDSRALALTPHGHPDLSQRHADLGATYTTRYHRLGDLADLEKAIECDSRALALTPNDHPDRSQRLGRLGGSYIDRYQRLGELADIEKAIEYGSHSLALTPDDDRDISYQHVSLGISYGNRYRRLGDLLDLEKAIEYKSRAIASSPDGYPNMPRWYSTLSVSYVDRYQRLDELADLEKAIECDSHALSLTPDGHPDMPGLYASLGVSLIYRYQRLGELKDLEEVIDYFSRALALSPDGHPDIPERHANMSASYTQRYQRLGELADLGMSIYHSDRAIALTPDGHPNLPRLHFNHGLELSNQYEHTGDLSYSRAALESFRTASHLPTGSPRDRFQCALRWANLAFLDRFNFLDPIEAYQTAIDLLPEFIWLGATTNQRYQDLSMVKNLSLKACSTAIQSSSYVIAVEWLEHTRCVVWNQNLMLRAPLDRLYNSHPRFAARLENVANQLHTLSTQIEPPTKVTPGSLTPEQIGKERRRLAADYHSLLAQVRQLPGFEDFLRPIKAKMLMGAALHGPVVILNCYSARCDALVILPGHDSITHLPLPDFTEEKAKKARSDLESSLKYQRIRERGVRVLGRSPPEDRFESMLGILWGDIVRPVLAYLGYLDDVSGDHLPHITWCPTGTLSFLPLHAAGDYSQPHARIFDYVVSSYTPTLTALLGSTPRTLDRGSRLLAIGQAITPGHNPLPGTTQELALVKQHTQTRTTVEYSQLMDAEATTATVLDAMEQHDWVHLACHAHQNVNDPTKSGFYLHDGILDLSAINRKSFKNKGLAFLSACQTATGDETLPDEAIHLASGMLMAGYPSVIATMWSVVDEDAPFVADKVYAQLMRDGKLGNGEAGRALHDAVAGLRQKVGEKEFGRWVPYIHIGS